MSFLGNNGDKFWFNYQTHNKVETLPYGVYRVQEETSTEPLTLIKQADPIKIELLGLSGEIVNTIVNQINISDKHTNVWLNGIKGMGKTQTCLQVAIKTKLPIVLIDKYLDIDDIVTIANGVNTDVIFVFDEFAKNYIDKEQDSKLLSFFDGIPFKHKIHSFVTLNTNLIPEYISGRTGRMEFIFTYNELTPEQATEYTMLKVNTFVDKNRLLDFYNTLDNINFDIVSYIYNCINAHGIEHFINICKYLNFEKIKFSVSHINVNMNGQDYILTLDFCADYSLTIVDENEDKIKYVIGYIDDELLSKLSLGENIVPRELIRKHCNVSHNILYCDNAVYTFFVKKEKSYNSNAKTITF